MSWRILRKYWVLSQPAATKYMEVTEHMKDFQYIRTYARPVWPTATKFVTVNHGGGVCLQGQPQPHPRYGATTLPKFLDSMRVPIPLDPQRPKFSWWPNWQTGRKASFYSVQHAPDLWDAGSSGQKKFTRRVCLMLMPFDLNRMMTQCTRSVCGTAKFHHFFFNEAIDCDKANSRNVWMSISSSYLIHLSTPV